MKILKHVRHAGKKDGKENQSAKAISRCSYGKLSSHPLMMGRYTFEYILEAPHK